MKIKLKSGDYFYPKRISEQQYAQALDKFSDAGFKPVIPYLSFAQWEYIGAPSSGEKILSHTNCEYSFTGGRLLAIDQVLNSSQKEEEMQEVNYVPLIGEKCEVKTQNSNLWFAITPMFISDTRIMYYAKHVNNDYFEGLLEIKVSEFRKLKVEREIFIDEAFQALSDNFKYSDLVLNQILTELYDAGFKGPNQ